MATEEKIAPQDSLQTIEDFEITNGEERMETFKSMKLNDDLYDSVLEKFDKPSLIQQLAIPIILKGKNLVMQSKSGSGKTAAFLISTLQSIDLSYPYCQVIILLNTRELARQTGDVFDSLTKFVKATRKMCLSGYEDKPLEAMYYIGTPGEVRYYLKEAQKERKFKPEKVKFLVIDEADSMLHGDVESNSVLGQIWDVKRYLQPKIQTILVSATHPPEMARIESTIVSNTYSKILVKEKKVVPSEICQFYMRTDTMEKTKPEIVLDIYNSLPDIGQTIVFVNTKIEANELNQYLNEHHVPSSILMAGDNEKRDNIIDDFKDLKIRFLITTNVLARGIDVLPVNFVINYNLPINFQAAEHGIMDVETYIHRIGRTGRFGMRGLAFTFTDDRDTDDITSLQSQQIMHAGEQNGFVIDEIDEYHLEDLPELIEENEEANKKLREKLHLEKNE